MDLNSFYRAAQSNAEGEKLPPVHLWNPENCGDIEIRIDRDGKWFHEGTRIGRQALVNLFSSILKREGEEHFLVTPQEKCRIQVDVAPLLVIGWELRNEGGPDQSILFETEQGAQVPLDKQHPLQLIHVDGEDYPVIDVRNSLQAIISRNVYYQLAHLIEEFDAQMLDATDNVFGDTPPANFLGIRSEGIVFPLISQHS